MTGKQLSDDHRAILAKLLQITKLNNHEIAWVLNVDERTIRRRRYEFAATGQLAKHKDVSQNAAKVKPHHLEKLVEWHKDHPDALLDDMQLFLKKNCGVEVSVPTISRQLKKAYGTFRREGRCARIRSRKQREAEGRSIAWEIQQGAGGNNAQSGAAELYQDQQQPAPLQQQQAAQQEPPRHELGLHATGGAA
ncbi:hypothetical protein MFIFM68171_01439 [Madurella fahalii]|uniref:Transposase n=1 Tax=Madurella fahalii TaxID=1157608 RepID=A0ABQ0G0H8_9PEZI